MKIIVIIITVFIGCFNNLNGKSLLNNFHIKKTVTLNSEKLLISSIQDAAVDQNDNFWIIDWKNSTLINFDKNGENSTLMASRGEGPGDLIMPEDIHISKNKHIFVANIMRRISEFDEKGKFIDAFIPTDGHFPTSCIKTDRDGNILIGGPKKKREEGILSGNMIHVYDKKGKFKNSFCPIDIKYGSLNLERYCSVFFDLDLCDNIFSVQPVSYKISIFDKNGKFLKTIGQKQDYYKEPSLLTSEIKRSKNELEKYEKNFTYVMNIFVNNDTVILLSRNYHGNNEPFIFYLDIYDCNTGKLIIGSLESDMFLFQIKESNFYFVKNCLNEKTLEELNQIIIGRFK